MTTTLTKPAAFTGLTDETNIAICFQCLAAYNNGRMHYFWCDLEKLYSDDDDLESFKQKFAECENYLIATSPECDAEELFFTSHQGIESIYSEYVDAETIFEYLEQRQLVIDDGKDPAIYEKWNANLGGSVNDRINDAQTFIDEYRGSAETHKEFAEEWYRESYTFSWMPSALIRHIDWQAVWDCELRHEFTDIEMDNEIHFIYS